MLLVEILSIRVGNPQVVMVSMVGWMLCSVRCDELGPIPPCLPISISIGGPKVRERHAPGRQGSTVGGRDFGTCWSGQWAPIN